jgi:hypothetical protein
MNWRRATGRTSRSLNSHSKVIDVWCGGILINRVVFRRTKRVRGNTPTEKWPLSHPRRWSGRDGEGRTKKARTKSWDSEGAGGERANGGDSSGINSRTPPHAPCEHPSPPNQYFHCPGTRGVTNAMGLPLVAQCEGSGFAVGPGDKTTRGDEWLSGRDEAHTCQPATR